MGLILLTLLVIIIIIIDKKIYKTLYTPSVILSVPFLVICFLYDLNSKNLGFMKMNYDVLYIWVFGLFFFWLTGLLVKLFVPIKIYNITLEEKKNNIGLYGIKIVNIAFGIALFLLYFLYISYKLYISQGGEEVEKYLGVGIQAHLLVVLKLLSIISFLSLFSRGRVILKLKSIFIILVVLSLTIMYSTKSGILITLISYYIAWVLFFNKKIKLLHVIVALALGFGTFYLSYSLIFGYLAPVEFIWNHMLLYYVSGTASMNAYFTNSNPTSIDWEMIYRTPMNIFNIITGNPEGVKVSFSNVWTSIGNDTYINVKTFFGTLYMYGGLFCGILSVCFFSFICHLFFILSRKKNSFIFLVLYSYLLAILCFGWFDFYFNTIAFYESIIFALFLNFFLINKKSYE